MKTKPFKFLYFCALLTFIFVRSDGGNIIQFPGNRKGGGGSNVIPFPKGGRKDIGCMDSTPPRKSLMRGFKRFKKYHFVCISGIPQNNIIMFWKDVIFGCVRVYNS
ncbi:hypothetical protein KIW84_056882 [Lathyrus oleraceus]|uniref:Uncharacterized protein n=1 Tax=Pisum sativum TaxID=3888 RepID=A0A9D5AK82_PEA|nr:hypothetical protein KIW84_056882 [Pisum sativum]